MKKIKNQVLWVKGLKHLTNNNYSLDLDDDFHSGCQNVSHQLPQQFLSGLHSFNWMIRLHYHM